MISYSLLICLIGLLVWGIFTWQKGGWLARVGELMFFAGLLTWLMVNGVKVVG